MTRRLSAAVFSIFLIAASAAATTAVILWPQSAPAKVAPSSKVARL